MMKKVIKVILCVVLFTISIGGLTACNSSNLNDYLKDGDKFLRYYLSICYKDNVMKNGLVSNKCFGFDIKDYSEE